MTISVAIIATNRICISPQCLDSAKKLSDDVVIVTNADHKFINYSDQKNYAASRCKYDWILSLDADEYISSALANEIKNLDFSSDAYYIPRLNYIFGKPIYHTNWGPSDDTHIWLFNKLKCRWVGDVHEEIKTDGKVGNLKGVKIHHNYTSVAQFMNKLNDYTSREKAGRNPIYEFVRRYIWHKGFLDGWHGLFLSYLMMIYHLSTWVKLWQKKNIS